MQIPLEPHFQQFFGEWWNGYTRVSETRGRKLVQVQILSRRPILAYARAGSPGGGLSLSRQ